MLQKYFKILSLGLFLLISGCFQIFPCKSKFSIEELSNATLNQPYLQEIEIVGGVMNTENSINWQIIPENSGLTIRRLTDDNLGWYRGIEISGIPKKQGEITIHLHGGGSGPPICFFDKTFILKVNPSIEQEAKD
ncbi:hypothetical protein [Entomomonas asaccharolytica]|uniref:Lipoprotein n=1 Tax=Entomomonas asaccharolytica TaxID=2785331 RepID=A0A974RW28_9GAMM|nr:hypothetical protein [Entomomonas asaccharolytica]QQP84753.1 hypothetical protein JHT90_10085 [Entomomonas asaccharolytica]